MKKNTIVVSALLGLTALLPLQSCIGSFALTNKVINWNNQVGSKFINELVFFAFWIIPVYEVTSLADLIVLNSIEFWSGNNPVEAYTKTVDTEQGKYYIACDQSGYHITLPDGNTIQLKFEEESSTWSAITSEGESFPFMTMIDSQHVKMITPNGEFESFELSPNGLQAYMTYTDHNDLSSL